MKSSNISLIYFNISVIIVNKYKIVNKFIFLTSKNKYVSLYFLIEFFKVLEVFSFVNIKQSPVFSFKY